MKDLTRICRRQEEEEEREREREGALYERLGNKMDDDSGARAVKGEGCPKGEGEK
jgi:hypothetical protein